MPTIRFIDAQGREHRASTAVGETVMDAALDSGIPGIIGRCGGGCTCSTCHCYVLDGRGARLPAPSADETELLRYVWHPRANSRLACQIVVDDSLDGLLVEIPAEQR